MEWMLTDEEIENIGPSIYDPFDHAIDQAQAKKLVEWERKNCTEHPWYEDGKGEPHYLLHKYCGDCQEELSRQVGLE